MMELTINNQVYQFNFGIGFVREVNSKVQKNIEDVQGRKQDMGLTFAIADVMDENPEGVVNVLYAANKGLNPRVSIPLLDSYIDDPNTDFSALCEEIMDFLSKQNATKKAVKDLQTMIAEQKAKNQ